MFEDFDSGQEQIIIAVLDIVVNEPINSYFKQVDRGLGHSE